MELLRLPHWLPAVAILLSAAAADSIGTKIHEHMSPEELRSVFHVDHPSLVPEYQLVQLTHHLARRSVVSGHAGNSHAPFSSKTPHEKGHQKNLPKKFTSFLDDQMFVDARKNIKDVDIIGDLNRTVAVHFGNSDSGERIEEDARTGVKDTAKTREDSRRYGEETEDTHTDTTRNNEEIDDAHMIEEEDLSDREHIEDEQDTDTHRIKMEAFGKELLLVLKRQEGLVKKDGLKMWNLLKNETQPDGVDFEELESGDDRETLGELFQDEASGAALLIRREPTSDRLVVEGSIGHELVIRPLPASLAPAAPAPDDEMFLEPGNMADMVSIDTGLPIQRRHASQRERVRRALSGAGHVIIKRQMAEGDHMSDYAFMEPDHLSKRFRRKRDAEQSHLAGKRRKREAPYVIYPEILVIVDYDGYRLHGGDNVQIKRYFVSFWNGVDLRYKLLKGPRIRVSIAGIIISRGRDATPYLERNRVGRDAIDSAAALTDMGKYLFRERRLPVYDIAVAITKLDMCRRQYANDACNRGTAGFAYVGGACVVNKRLEKVNSVAIIEDTGGFSGIIVAAHEVGHLLGAVHDGSPPPSYLGGPGAEKCRWEDGFIMSDLRHTEKGFRWSPCSVQSFHHFLNGDTATCLYNSPHEDDSLPRVLPGRLLTLDAQCRKDRGTSACFKDERVCAQLFCFDAGSGYCVAYRPAAEGSPCGDGQYCINGRCIAELENIIPDYSQHTPSYVRPDTSPFYNATSVEETTQSYATSPPAENIHNYYKYDYSSPDGDSSPNPVSLVTTENPYKLYYYPQSTTKKPYEFNYQTTETKSTSYTLPSSSVTQHPYVYNKYSITSTKSPYDFQDFATRRAVKTTQKPSTSTDYPYERPRENYNRYESITGNPYRKSTEIAIHNNEQLNTTSEVYQLSTSNPYEKSTERPRFFSKTDLDGFFNRTTTKSPYGYSFNKASNVKSLYKIGTYYSQPKNDNAIRPEANSQQVQIEPARLVHSYQTNVTANGRHFEFPCTEQNAQYRVECQTPQIAAATRK